MIKVAVVILNWNGIAYLKKFLPILELNTTLNECAIYVVDNHSTDNSLTYIHSNHPDIKTISFDKNYGFAEGYSRALRQIDAPYYVLLNSDVEVTPGWLEPILEYMDHQADTGAAMPKIRAYHKKDYFEYAGAAGGLLDLYGYPYCRGRILNTIEKDNGQYDNVTNIFWASGACFVVRSEVYRQAGGLDEDFFAHMEEIDLSWRIKKLGYRIVCVPQSLVYHVGGGTLPNNNPRKLFYNYRNSLYLLFKNLHRYQLVTVLVPRLILDNLSALVYLFRFSFRFFWAVVSAHFTFYLAIPSLLKKRKRIQANTKVTSFHEVFKGSIVFQFFLRRKKTYSDLERISVSQRMVTVKSNPHSKQL
jgi:GT2 family glycosyltransferase